MADPIRPVELVYCVLLGSILLMAMLVFGMVVLLYLGYKSAERRHDARQRGIVAAVRGRVEEITGDSGRGPAAVVAIVVLALASNLTAMNIPEAPMNQQYSQADVVEAEKQIESLYKGHDYDAVMSACDRLIVLDHGSGFAHHYRALVFRHRGQPSRFLDELRTAARLDFAPSLALLAKHQAGNG